MHMIERHAIPLQSAIRPILPLTRKYGKATSLKLLTIQPGPFYLDILLGVWLHWGGHGWKPAKASFFFFLLWGEEWTFLFSLLAHGRLETKLRRTLLNNVLDDEDKNYLDSAWAIFLKMAQ